VGTTPTRDGADPFVRTDLRVDGARLACWTAGPPSGAPVLALHGYLGSHCSWRRQAPALAAAGVRLVAPDWFGWGESEMASDARFERDVERIGQLADALGWGGFDLFGHDYGGFIGLAFAQQHPERVRRLALLNTRAHRSFRPRWYLAFELVVRLARDPVGRALLRALPVASLHRLAVRGERRAGIIDEDAMRSYTRRLDGRTLSHIFRDYRLPPRPELDARLAQMRCPTRILWGARDRYLDPSVASDLAERIPSARLVLFEEAGHFLMEERPEPVTDHLLDLLGLLDEPLAPPEGAA
jgi:pimeloyl-ACP methyl ester carboxylesterase